MGVGVEWVLEEVRLEVGEVREEVVVLDSRARAAVAARGGLESRSSKWL